MVTKENVRLNESTDNQHADKPNPIDHYVKERINFRVRSLVHNYGFNDEDVYDLKQEMVLEILKAKKRFDPEKTKWKTFVNNVLDLYYKHVMRSRICRIKHESMSPAMFSEIEDEEINHELNEMTCESRDYIRGSQLRMDIEQILPQMPLRLQEICQCLMFLSPYETSQQLNIAPSTVSRAIPRIREYFFEAGFEKFHIRTQKKRRSRR